MNETRPTAHILGTALRVSFGDASKSLTDLIFDCVSAALKDAGTGIAEVDSVVLAAHDLIDGRSLSSMVTAPAAGAYLRDEIRLSDDGLAAASLAAARIEAGESAVSIVAAWGRASEGGFPAMSLSSMDPFTEQPFGLGDLDVSAFRLSRWLSAHPADDHARRAAAALRQLRAAASLHGLQKQGGTLPAPAPLRSDEVSPLADVFAAMIVAARPGRTRFAGVGHGADTPQIGARDFLAMPAATAAARTALEAANIALPDVAVLEIDGVTLSDEIIAMEALGICPAGQGFAAYAGSDRVNASGAGAAGWCFPAMGLVRLVEANRRLLALDAGAETRRTALALGHGGNGAQTSTAIVLEAA